jgi:hypothetical protein
MVLRGAIRGKTGRTGVLYFVKQSMAAAAHGRIMGVLPGSVARAAPVAPLTTLVKLVS